MRRWQFSSRSMLFAITIVGVLLATAVIVSWSIYASWESITYQTVVVRVTSSGTVRFGSDEVPVGECFALLASSAQSFRSHGIKPDLLIEAYSNTKQSDVETVVELGEKPGFESLKTERLAWPDRTDDVEAMIRQLDSSDLDERQAAMEKLGSMGRTALPAVPKLIEFLEPMDERADLEMTDEERMERESIQLGATFALADIGEPEVVESLVRFSLEHARHCYEDPAVAVLRQVKNKGGFAALKQALKDEDAKVRQVAAEALSPRDYDSLLIALEDPELYMRQIAVKNARRFGAERGIAVLSRSIRDAETSVRMASVRELRAMENQCTVEPLLIAAKDSNTEIRYTAIGILNELKAPRALGTFIDALNDDDSLVRCAAARALGNTFDARAIEPLEAATQDEDSFVRKHASESLKSVVRSSKENTHRH